MRLHSPWDGIILAAVGCGSLLTLVGVVRRVLSAGVCKIVRFLLTQVKTKVKAAASCHSGQGQGQGQGQDLINVIINEKLILDKVRLFRTGLMVCSVFSSMVLSAYYVTRKSQATTTMAPVDEAVLALSGLYFGCVAACPNLVTARTLDLHYCTTAALLTIPVVTCEQGVLPRRVIVGNVGMGVINAIRRTLPGQRLPLFAIVNGVFGLCAAGAILENSIELPFIQSMAQALMVTLMCLGSLSLEGGFRLIARRVLELQEVKELYSAACAVLRSSCDVLVELDMEGCMTEGATELGSFLLRGGHSRSLQGVPLCDLMVEDGDRELFAERLREPRLQRIGLAENVQVTMQDGCGNRLRLELVWFQFTRSTGQGSITVGIREVSDLLPPFWRSEEVPRVDDGNSLDHNKVTNTDMDEMDTTSQTSGCSSIPEDTAVSGIPRSQPMVVLNALGQGMPIEEVTQSFRSRIGRLPLGVPMVRYVQRPERFLRWVQDSLNDEMHFGEESRQRSVTLQMPTGHLVDAKVALIPDRDSLEQMVGEGARLRLVLVFFKVRIRVPHHMEAYAQVDLRGPPRRRHIPSTSPAEAVKIQL